MHIRPASDRDSDHLWAMLEPVFRAGDTYCLPVDVGREAALTYWCKDPHAVFLAETGGGVLGSYFLTPNQQGGGSHVCNCGFVTAKGARGKGVARRMLEDSLQRAKALGYRAMQFNFVVSSNIRAIAIWQDYGFVTVGRLPRAFLHPVNGYVDALVMYRDL